MVKGDCDYLLEEAPHGLHVGQRLGDHPVAHSQIGKRGVELENVRVHHDEITRGKLAFHNLTLKIEK